MSNFDKYEAWVRRYADRISRKPNNNDGKPKDEQQDEQNNDNAGRSPLILPPNSGNATFLVGDFGKSFLKEYNIMVKADYNDAPVLKKLNWDDKQKIVTGSNPFAVVVANKVLQNSGSMRVATQAELEDILQKNTLPLKDRYEESALVWRSDANPNQYLAKVLKDKFKIYGGIDFKNGEAYVLPLWTLDLVKDQNSPHGVSFVPTNFITHFKAPILMSKDGSYFKSEEINKNTGLPNIVYPSAVAGNRQLWTRDSGVSGLYLYGSLNIDSNNESLACSNDDCRVVCIAPAGAAQKNP